MQESLLRSTVDATIQREIQTSGIDPILLDLFAPSRRGHYLNNSVAGLAEINICSMLSYTFKFPVKGVVCNILHIGSYYAHAELTAQGFRAYYHNFDTGGSGYKGTQIKEFIPITFPNTLSPEQLACMELQSMKLISAIRALPTRAIHHPSLTSLQPNPCLVLKEDPPPQWLELNPIKLASVESLTPTIDQYP